MIITDFERFTHDPIINTHMQYFFQVSAPALRNHRTAVFWNTTVLQACQQVPSLRHLAVSVASLERFQRENPDIVVRPEDNELHMVHYNKALKLMSGSRDVGEMLIGCLMLVLLEDLRRAPYTALLHIKAGRQVLDDKNIAFCDRYLFETLNALFKSLFDHQSELAATYIRVNYLYKRYHEPRPRPYALCAVADTPPTAFESLAQAFQALARLRDQCVKPRQFARPLSRFNIVPGVTQELNDWLENFNTFHSCLNYEQQDIHKCEIHALRAYHLILKIVSCSTAQDRETCYDYFDQDLAGLVQKFAILCELGLVDLSPLLFFVACKYRDVAGRRRVIQLLRYRVNGWEGSFLADVAEAIVETEEDGLDRPVTFADIPESSRVKPKAVVPDLCPDGRIQLCMVRAPFNSFAQKLTIDLPVSNDSIDATRKNEVRLH